jgi:hypothetical protein
VILFGVRSPLIVDVEETLARLGIAISAAVNVNGAPRLFDRSRLVEIADFAPRAGDPFIVTAFSPRRRRGLTEQAEALGLVKAAAIVDPTAILPRSIRIGAGSYVNAGVVIGGMSVLGESVFINRSASLGHHSMLGDFVTIGPGATLAGNIHIGEGAVIGAGAVIHPHVRIASGSVVSAGAVVRKDVPAGKLAVGNPAILRPHLERNSSINVEDEE